MNFATFRSKSSSFLPSQNPPFKAINPQIFLESTESLVKRKMPMGKFYAIILGVLVMGCGYYFDSVHARPLNFTKMRIPGASHDCHGFQNNGEIESLAKFAVQEHNKKQNVVIEFVRVVKAKEQVVAGKLYYLTLEALDAGKKKIFEAKVWVKPWMNFKQLQEFKHVETDNSSTPSALLIRQRIRA